MSNYGIFTNFVFAGVNSKMRYFQQERREKTVIAAVSVATNFLSHDKRLSKWLENRVATQNLKISR